MDVIQWFNKQNVHPDLLTSLNAQEEAIDKKCHAHDMNDEIIVEIDIEAVQQTLATIAILSCDISVGTIVELCMLQN